MNEQQQAVFNQLLNDFAEFKEHWAEYVAGELEYDEEFDPSLYEVATEFSQCVIEQYQCSNDIFLVNAFDRLEQMSNHPDSDISECALVGFVEGILMQRNHQGIALDAFDKYLGPSSKDFWYNMHDFFTSETKSTIVSKGYFKRLVDFVKNLKML